MALLALRPSSASLCAILLLAQRAGGELRAQAVPVPLRQMQHSTWNSKDGIPAIGISRMARTPDGYLWFSSPAGMVRFDGLRFTLIDSTRYPQIRGSGPYEPRLLGVDHRGALLWAGKQGEVMEDRDGAVRQLDSGRTRLHRTTTMELDRQNRVWVVVDNERHLRELRDGRLLPTGFPPQVPDTGVLGMTPDSGRGLWVGTRTQGVWHISGDNTARQYRSTSAGGSRPLLQDRSGRLWLLGDGLTLLRDTLTERITLPGHSADLLWAVTAAEAPDGGVWFGTRGQGVLRYLHGQLEEFSEAQGLSDAVVHDLLIDPSGSVWVITDAGLDRLRVAPFTTLGRQDGLPFESPLLIFEDAGGFIWGSGYGVDKVFRLGGGTIQRSAGLVRAEEEQLLSDKRYVVLGPRRSGGLWVTSDEPRRLLRLEHHRLTPETGVRVPPALHWRLAIETRTTLTWFLLEPNVLGVMQDGHFHLVPLGAPTSHPVIASATPAADDGLWVSTDEPSGLYHVSAPGRVEAIPLDPAPTDKIESLVMEGHDTLWAVSGGHLVRITGGHVARVQIPDLSNMLLSRSNVLIVQRGFLWIASEAGIVRLKLAALHLTADGHTTPVVVRRFDDRDGLTVGKTTTINPHPALLAHDDRLWFSTPAGLAVADPALIIPDTIAPIPHVEELTVDGQRSRLDSTVVVGPNPDRLEFRYSATGPVDPHRIALEYMLEGVDRHWNPSGTERFVAYGHLRPGRYAFRVRAINGDGLPSAADAVLSFRVTPTWFQTWTFLIALVLATTAAIATVLSIIQRARLRTTQERMQARYDATLAERTRLARELHDTLLQGFTGITLQLQAVRGAMTNAPREAAISLGEVLTTADATLREARQMVWDMRAPELDHHELPEALEIAARQAVGGSGIQLQMSVIGRSRQLDIGLATTVLRIGKEAVANAVKHADPTRIAVTLEFGASALRLAVEDDGRGCDPAALDAAVERGHWGIRGMRERASHYAGTLDISVGASRGTTIALAIALPEA